MQIRLRLVSLAFITSLCLCIPSAFASQTVLLNPDGANFASGTSISIGNWIAILAQNVTTDFMQENATETVFSSVFAPSQILGNVTGTWTFSYDPRNHLITVFPPAGSGTQTLEFVYGCGACTTQSTQTQTNQGNPLYIFVVVLAVVVLYFTLSKNRRKRER